MSWTPEQDETLKRLRARGATNTEIGIILGKSKGSVAGRAHRKKYKTPNAPMLPVNGAPRRAQTHSEVIKHIARADAYGKKLMRSAAWEPLEGTAPVPLEDVCECRWPVTGKPLFCNRPRVEGSSYCERHKAISEPAA